MSKRTVLFTYLTLMGMLLGACSTPTGLAPATSTPTIVPPQPTETQATTATAAASIATETAVPVTPTATIPPVNAIPHFPTGQEFSVTFINMMDADTGWAIGGLAGASDHVLRSTDGGATWADRTPPEEVAPSGDGKTASGHFIDGERAWVVYANTSGATPARSVVWRTQDAGITWEASQPLDLTGLTEFYNPSNLQFADGQNGWMLVHVGVGMNHDYVVLYRSDDGGLSWQRLIDPYNDTTGIMSCAKTAMLFTDAAHGWLTGDCHGVAAGVLLFRSVDGGASWQSVSLPDPASAPGLFSDMLGACGAYDPFFFSNEQGHLGVRCADYLLDPITYQYFVYTTQDGGNTWSSSTYPGEGLYFITMQTGLALAAKIQRTTDGGLTWTPISAVTWSAQVDFVSDQTGWGVARAGEELALVKTMNGGARWIMVTPVVGQ